MGLDKFGQLCDSGQSVATGSLLRLILKTLFNTSQKHGLEIRLVHLFYGLEKAIFGKNFFKLLGVRIRLDPFSQRHFNWPPNWVGVSSSLFLSLRCVCEKNFNSSLKFHS